MRPARAARVVRVLTRHPADTEGLATSGVDPSTVVAVVGKTEGNGCVNDFTRMLAARAWAEVLPVDAVSVMSGGTEGVLSPHVSLIATEAGSGSDVGLVAKTAVTAPIGPVDLGQAVHVDEVARTVRIALTEAGIAPSDAHLVLVKCPLLSSEQVETHRDAVVTTDPYESMAASRAASASGIAQVTADGSTWSGVASASSGAEVDRCHIVILGMAAGGSPRQRIDHVVMRDALDAAPVIDLLDRIRAEGGQVVQVFAKAEADPSGFIRGRRHTMLTDSDVHSTRHARAAVAGLLAGLVGEPAIYVSGGAEEQGPPGGGPVAVVWEAAP